MGPSLSDIESTVGPTLSLIVSENSSALCRIRSLFSSKSARVSSPGFGAISIPITVPIIQPTSRPVVNPLPSLAIEYLHAAEFSVVFIAICA